MCNSDTSKKNIYFSTSNYIKEEHNPDNNIRVYPITGKFTLSTEFTSAFTTKIIEILGVPANIDYEYNKWFLGGFDVFIESHYITLPEIELKLAGINHIEWDKNNSKQVLQYDGELKTKPSKIRFKLDFEPTRKTTGTPGVDYLVNNDGLWYKRDGNDFLYDQAECPIDGNELMYDGQWGVYDCECTDV